METKDKEIGEERHTVKRLAYELKEMREGMKENTGENRFTNIAAEKEREWRPRK